MTQKRFIAAVLLLSAIVLLSSGKLNDNAYISGSNEFNTITIGDQEWMAENLDVDTFRNGDPIPEAKTDEEWERAKKNGTPAWCYYENNPDNGKIYGKLYNWYAVNDPRGLAPEGWHVPDMDEWVVLADYLGGADVAGNKMKSTSGWTEGGNGSDESGFSGVPGGNRSDFGSFYSLGDQGIWWSSTEHDEMPGYAWYCNLSYDTGSLDWFYNTKAEGCSVRCLRD